MNTMTELGRLPLIGDHELSLVQISLFFSTFVFLQFWNMFNAKAFGSTRSAFHFRDCGGFLLIAGIILTGQIFIVTVGGPLFSVTTLTVADWAIIIGGTSAVLWIRELLHLITKTRSRQ